MRVYQLSDFGETVTTYKVRISQSSLSTIDLTTFFLQIVDGHADTSGVSASSNEDANTDTTAGAYEAAAAAEAEAELEVEKQIEALNEALADGTSTQAGAPRKRQKMDNLRQKIDEMVLVGEGAPGY